jgi:phosphoribosylformimino-5-aminoimidazole carboxamide ribotide isomerase
MNIIPVIDLQNGLVVAAKQGLRKTYTPIQSTLSCSSKILDVIDGFLSLFPFKNIYIADLNAIIGIGNNQNLIDTVIKKHSSINFWVDNGIKVENISLITDTDYRPVIGSESQNTHFLNNVLKYPDFSILSLDFFPIKGYIGPEELINNPNLWPKDIIIMTLNKVGKKQGPDIEKLQYFYTKYPNKNFIAAGGIRHEQDLLELRGMGIQDALVASALHSGEINKETIKKLYS